VSGFGVGDFVKGKIKNHQAEQLGLTEAYAKYLDSLVDEWRDGFHISQLWRFSPVRWVLERALKKQRKIPFSLRYRFDVGTALHRMIQQHFADMGILKGFWECKNGHRTEVVSFRPPECASCGAKRLWYSEIGVGYEVEPGFKIVGRTDGVLSWNGEDMGLEIKSIDPDRLSFIGGPDFYPVFQLRLYMKLLRESFFPDMKRGIILYASWSSKEVILLPVRPFIVEYNDDPWNEVLPKVKEAVALWRAFEEKTLTVPELIAKRTCKTESDGRKVECPVTKECFSTAFLSQMLEEKFLRRA
jgi:hypothetical protein